MPHSIERLEQTLHENVGDPRIMVVPASRQIVCGETEEDLVREIARRYVESVDEFAIVGVY
jgi:hypothetical protein